jgi:glycosyltransferase involved in cell wall biosynthesis
MSHILSEPFIYENDETYIAVKYDWSDLEERIDYVLSDYKNIRERLVQNMRKRFEEKYNLEHLVLHIYNIFKNLENVGVDV